MALFKLFIWIGTPVVSGILFLLITGYKNRLRIYQLRKQGVAMPPGWSWWFGHLRVLDAKLKPLPPDVNVYMAMKDLVRDHADAEVFVMDYWPIFKPVLMISGPDVALQATVQHELPKPDNEVSFRPIIGGPSLITMNNEQWRVWRSLLNPAFSASHMLSLVPSVVDAADVFCDILDQHVDQDAFLLDPVATRLTMDVITKTTLDTDLNNQRSEHKISHALKTILNWHSFWEPRILLNPARIPVQWYYSRVIEGFIHEELEKRFEELKQERAIAKNDPSHKRKAKSVIALTLDAYITQKQEASKQPLESLKLEKGFAQIAANQIRLFIFAGNDTTATLLVYTYHVLAQHPDILSKMREEHDKVFGSGTDAGSMLREQPALINLCRYTLAVVKETLRLYPPSSSLRDGVAGTSLVDQNGTIIPTEGLNATIMHHYVHTNPRIWPQPLEFLPERWLVEPSHELYPPTGAFRPFEQGLRNCIGQTLVLNELRTVLAMTVRKYSIKPAYDEWDAMLLAKESLFTRTLRQWGLKSNHCKTVFGERAYQTSRAGAHPADGYPCRVELVKD